MIKILIILFLIAIATHIVAVVRMMYKTYFPSNYNDSLEHAKSLRVFGIIDLTLLVVGFIIIIFNFSKF